jgi:hypothetical protein
VKAEVLDLLQTESSNRALAHALSVENEEAALPILSVKLLAHHDSLRAASVADE